LEQAIGPLSTKEEDALDTTAASAVAGDKTTWRWSDDERRDVHAEKPPIWHAGQEVEKVAVCTTPQRGAASSTKDNRGAF
jgi:hypothetical protein